MDELHMFGNRLHADQCVTLLTITIAQGVRDVKVLRIGRRNISHQWYWLGIGGDGGRDTRQNRESTFFTIHRFDRLGDMGDEGW